MDQVNHFAVDSRKVKEGSLFFAFPGKNSHGLDHLEEVAAKGAAGAVIPNGSKAPLNLPCIRVADPLKALQALAKKKIDKIAPFSIAITGSYGKTSTKEVCFDLFNQSFSCFKTPGNANSQIGLPLSILNELQPFHTHAIFEMGMDRAGQILNLVKLVQPKVAILTAVDFVHSENFKNLEEIAAAKEEIFASETLELCLVEASVPFQTKGAITYSINNPNATYFFDVGESWLTLYFEGVALEKLRKPRFTQTHQLENFLAAVIAAKKYGASLELTEIPSLKGRGNHMKKSGVTFIDDAYNASFETTKNALIQLKNRSITGKKVVVLGSLLEIGPQAAVFHLELVRLAASFADQLYLVGDDYSFYGKTFTREEVVLHLEQTLGPGDWVLLKGANAHKLSLVIDEVAFV